MKFAVVAVVAAMSAPAASTQAGQAPQSRGGQPPATSSGKIAAAYEQFLLAQYLESNDDVNGAVAALKRAITLDPSAADLPAELAGLYMRQSQAQEALDAAAQALEIEPANREAHRVAGIIYAALAEAGRGIGSRRRGEPSDENVAKAIEHLEAVIERPGGDNDPNVRATLSRLYIRNGAFAKAIPLLKDLVKQEPGWQDGPMLLGEAYSGHAAALLNAPGRAAAAEARDLLAELLAERPNEPRALYLMSQAQRRLGDVTGAEATARRVIAQNAKSPWGYYALAEALEERHQYQAVVDALAPAMADFRSRASSDSFELVMLLPHAGFAYQQLGQFDNAIAAFDEAHRLAPDDTSVTSYLIQAHLSAKKYSQALEIARQARAARPGDLRLARLEAQALRQSGKTDEAVALLEGVVKTQAGEPAAYVALAQLYADADRGAQAVKVLQDAQAKFPAERSIPFELGAVFDKQKRFADAEAAFKQVLARDPDNAAALNYLGYMLAERGDRLDESVSYIKKALELDPENGSYLDSLGWAYFKAEKLDLADQHLKRAADQLTMNSVIQDHYGDVLFKRARYDDAIAAWTRALAGDGDSIDRAAIDKKIRAARQKLGRK